MLRRVYSLMFTAVFLRFIYLVIIIILTVAGLLLLPVGLLSLWQAGAALSCSMWASHCSGFSCCRAQALGARVSGVAVRGLTGSRALAQQLGCTGFLAPWQARSSWTRDGNSGLFFFFFLFFFFIGVAFVIHWNESAMGLHVFPIPIPPPTSLSTWSL